MKHQRRFPGQSLVEFALIFPIVLFLSAGFLDLGRAIFYYSSISNMVREGARYAIIDSNAETGPFLENINRINEYSFGISDVSTSPTNACSYPGPCSFEGQDIVVTIERIQDVNVKVEATYTFKPVTPGIKRIFGSSTGIDLVAQSTMRISGAAR